MRKLMTAALSGALFAGTLALTAVPASADMAEFCNRHPGASECLYRDNRAARSYDRDRYYVRRHDPYYGPYAGRHYGYPYGEPYYGYRRPYGGGGAAALFGFAAGAAVAGALDHHWD